MSEAIITTNVVIDAIAILFVMACMVTTFLWEKHCSDCIDSLDTFHVCVRILIIAVALIGTYVLSPYLLAR